MICLLQKSWLPRQRFGLELMLLIAFMLFPADWPKLIVGRYRSRLNSFVDLIHFFKKKFHELGFGLIDMCICQSNATTFFFVELFKATIFLIRNY